MSFLTSLLDQKPMERGAAADDEPSYSCPRIDHIYWENSCSHLLKCVDPGVILIQSGWSVFHHRETVVRADAGDILLLAPGDWFRRSYPGTETVGLIFVSLTVQNGHVLQPHHIPLMDCFDLARQQKIIRLPGTNDASNTASLIIQAMANEAVSNPKSSAPARAALFDAFAAVCTRLLQARLGEIKPGELAARRKLKGILEAIHQNIGDDFNWNELARKFGFSPLYFQRMFRKTFGSTPAKYVQCVRLARAEQQLVSTSRTISEICYATGFKSISNFNSSFRRFTGVPPSYIRACAKAGVNSASQSRITREQYRPAILNQWQQPYPFATQKSANWKNLDLAPHLNRSARASKDGWFDYPLTFPFLPSGDHIFHGVPFHLEAETSRQSKTCLIMKSALMRKSRGNPLPAQVQIDCNLSARAVYFLHACGWAKDHAPFASYTLQYEEGPDERIALTPYGIRPDNSSATHADRATASNIQDWWASYEQFAHGAARPVLFENPLEIGQVRYVYTLEILISSANRKLRSILINSDPNRDATLGLLAITACLNED